MTSQGGDGPNEPIDLTKPPGADRPGPDDGSGAARADQPGLDFDPYRFGLPDHPVPPEFAPPGYRPPAPTAPTAPPTPYSPYGPSSPYGAAPGTPPYAAGGPGQFDRPGGHPGYPEPAGYPPLSSPYGPPYPGQPTSRPNHGKAIASMVCGIVSIVFCWLSYLDALIVLPGLILGIIVLSDRRSSSRGMALAGVICSVIGAILAVLLTIYLVHLVNQCGGANSNDLQRCIRTKI